jgi:hypothetical protein
MIDLNPVVALLRNAKCAELIITCKLNRMLRENTISYSAIWKCVRMFMSAATEPDISILSKSDGDSNRNKRFALVLSVKSFLSIHQIVTKVMMPKLTVHRHLRQGMRSELGPL